METVKLNDRLMVAEVTETQDGFLLKLAGIFTVPEGHRVLMERRFKRWRLVVDQSVRCPAGEQETWIWMSHVQERPEAVA